jgi:DsbC/DsbD-like thiol-disulfide interchange protein
MHSKLPIIRIAALLCLLSSTAQTQILHPVKWSYGAKKLCKNKAVIFIKATIEDGWHIYSAYQKEGGPLKTSFEFTGHELTGNISEPTPLSRFEKSFNMNVTYFEHEVIFQQKIKIRQAQADKVVVVGTVSFMCCNDQKCLAPETVNFSIPIK